MFYFLAVVSCLSIIGCIYAACYPIPHAITAPKNVSEISHPFKPNTVPFGVVIIFAAIAPYFIVAAYAFLTNMKQRRALLLFSSLLCSQIFMTACVENMKIAVRRHRPDFYHRCMPNEKGICTGDPRLVWGGLKSMPSGHTAQSFNVFIYATYVFAVERIRWRKAVPLLGIGFTLAVLVGISRVLDHRHFITDVLAGAIVGSAATFAILLPIRKVLL